MAIGGFASYGELLKGNEQNSGVGALMQGQGIGKQLRTNWKMQQSEGELADALKNNNYEQASAIAMNAGDLDTATKMAQLRDAELARQGDVAFRNAQIANDAERNKIAWYNAMNKGEKKTKEDAEAEKRTRESAQQALQDLYKIGKGGKLTRYSAEKGGLFGQASEEVGKRQAAISALVPLASKIARDSGISGINSLGEVLTYVGLPENATSEQILGALPLISFKLGLSNPAEMEQPNQGQDQGQDQGQVPQQSSGLDDLYNSIK